MKQRTKTAQKKIADRDAQEMMKDELLREQFPIKEAPGPSTSTEISRTDMPLSAVYGYQINTLLDLDGKDKLRETWETHIGRKE